MLWHDDDYMLEKSWSVHVSCKTSFTVASMRLLSASHMAPSSEHSLPAGCASEGKNSIDHLLQSDAADF